MQAPRSLVALCLLAGCSIPQLDTPNAAEIARQDYPELRPLSELTAEAGARSQTITPGVTDGLRARAAGLRARARVLRQSALTPADRERIRSGLARLNAARAEG
ncbi:hypothetical protein [Palleronia pelagia]|uniref:Uncharacterized protein n=1 Tax=Palleronia pelagia TaxID=387096 RepID=A0A1H8LSI2_9RHOB|nr:hypothetical protein [Palleronia pelagia]SEO08063.1 hypothetical protein SAMN04488011_11173 [Palleronia pelagia]